MSQNWKRFTTWLLGTSIGLILGLMAFVVVMNPFGHLPFLFWRSHVIMDTNQRFQYPSIIRSGDYDAVVFGSSTSRLLRPERLEKHFGGNFAILSMNDGRPWEIHKQAHFYLDHQPKPKTLIFGMDKLWCTQNIDEGINIASGRIWPDWIYDTNRTNDWLYLLNGKAIEVSARLVGNRLGFLEPRMPADGYRDFLPPDAEYDAARAFYKHWRGNTPNLDRFNADIKAPSQSQLAKWDYPAYDWMVDIMSRVDKDTHVVFAFMPLHVAHQPVPSSESGTELAVCKNMFYQLAEKHGAQYIDFLYPTHVTKDDLLYWDPLHYRVSLADPIVDAIAKPDTTEIEPKFWRTKPPSLDL